MVVDGTASVAVTVMVVSVEVLGEARVVCVAGVDAARLRGSRAS